SLFRLLSSVWVLISSIFFLLAQHSTTQRVTWHHAFNGKLDSTLRVLLDELFKVRCFQATWKTRVTVICFLRSFVACDTHFLIVHNNNIITGIYMRCVLRLVLTT